MQSLVGLFRPGIIGVTERWLQETLPYSVQSPGSTADTCACVCLRRLFERMSLVYVKVNLRSEVVSCSVSETPENNRKFWFLGDVF